MFSYYGFESCETKRTGLNPSTLPIDGYLMKKKTSLEANSCWNFFDVSIRLCRLRVKWWRKNDYDYITQDQYAERHGRRQRRHPLKRLGSPTVKPGRILSIKYCSTRPWWVFFLCRSSPSFVVRSPSDGKKSVDRFSDWKISEDLKTERLTRTKDVVVLHLRFSSVSSATANTTADISQDRPSRSGPQKRASCGRLRLFSYGQLMRSFAQSENWSL